VGEVETDCGEGRQRDVSLKKERTGCDGMRPCACALVTVTEQQWGRRDDDPVEERYEGEVDRLGCLCARWAKPIDHRMKACAGQRCDGEMGVWVEECPCLGVVLDIAR